MPLTLLSTIIRNPAFSASDPVQLNQALIALMQDLVNLNNVPAAGGNVTGVAPTTSGAIAFFNNTAGTGIQQISTDSGAIHVENTIGSLPRTASPIVDGELLVGLAVTDSGGNYVGINSDTPANLGLLSTDGSTDGAQGTAQKFSAGIYTNDPGQGSGTWLLGGFVNGLVTPDASNYVEINIDGSIIKLIVAQ